jgi:hypothetical protein
MPGLVIVVHDVEGKDEATELQIRVVEHLHVVCLRVSVLQNIEYRMQEVPMIWVRRTMISDILFKN